mgnify:FL=1
MNVEKAIKIKAIIDAQNEKNKNYRRKLQNNLMDYQEDSEKELREKEKKCKTCYYLKKEKIILDCQTTHICKLCGESFISFDQNERICPNCVNEHDVCRHCGQKIE